MVWCALKIRQAKRKQNGKTGQHQDKKKSTSTTSSINARTHTKLAMFICLFHLRRKKNQTSVLFFCLFQH